MVDETPELLEDVFRTFPDSGFGEEAMLTLLALAPSVVVGN
jgi:hypothetical protein